MIEVEQISNKITEILNTLSPHFLYVKLGGSRSLPFIKNPHDYDIIIICEKEEDRFICSKLFHNTYDSKELRFTYGLDFHIITLEYENFFVNSIYPYLIQETDIIYSTIKDFLPKNRDINYMLANEATIIAKYKKRIHSEKLMHEGVKYKHKFWYYAYTAICIFKNKSFNLTEEQINNINMLHDRKDETWPSRVALIDTMIQELESW